MKVHIAETEVELALDEREVHALYAVLEPYATVQWEGTEDTVAPRLKQLHWMFWSLHASLFGDA